MKQNTFNHYKEELLRSLSEAHGHVEVAISAASELGLDETDLRDIYNRLKDEMNSLEDLENE